MHALRFAARSRSFRSVRRLDWVAELHDTVLYSEVGVGGRREGKGMWRLGFVVVVFVVFVSLRGGCSSCSITRMGDHDPLPESKLRVVALTSTGCVYSNKLSLMRWYWTDTLRIQ